MMVGSAPAYGSDSLSAVIAQRAEQPPRKRQVAGSIPARGFERGTGISPANKFGCVAQR